MNMGIRGEVGHGVKWDNYEYFWGKIHCAKTIWSIYFFLVLLEAQEHLLNTYYTPILSKIINDGLRPQNIK